MSFAFDFDGTVPLLKKHGYEFPEEGWVITSRPITQKEFVEDELLHQGLIRYPLLVNKRNTKGSNRDTGGMFKARTIMEHAITAFYDDSEYELRIIARYCERKKYPCQLFQVDARGIHPFNLRKWIPG